MSLVPRQLLIWCLLCVVYLSATLYFEMIIHPEIAKANKKTKNVDKTPLVLPPASPTMISYQDTDIGAILLPRLQTLLEDFNRYLFVCLIYLFIYF